MVVGQDVSVSVQNPVYGSVGFQSCQVVIEGQMPDLLQFKVLVFKRNFLRILYWIELIWPHVIHRKWMRKAENKHGLAVEHLLKNFPKIHQHCRLTSYTRPHEFVEAISATSASILELNWLSNGDHVQENVSSTNFFSLSVFLYRIAWLTGSTLRDRIQRHGFFVKK